MNHRDHPSNFFFHFPPPPPQDKFFYGRRKCVVSDSTFQTLIQCCKCQKYRTMVSDQAAATFQCADKPGYDCGLQCDGCFSMTRCRCAKKWSSSFFFLCLCLLFFPFFFSFFPFCPFFLLIIFLCVVLLFPFYLLPFSLLSFFFVFFLVFLAVFIFD
jgi:hypothetical protein